MNRRNKVIIAGYTIIISIIFAAYTIVGITSVKSGARSLGYFLLLAGLCLIPYLLAVMVYFKNKETKTLQYITAYGFLIGYTFMQFTLSSDLVFIYVLPILSLLIIANNTRLLTIWSIIVVLINIASCSVKFARGITDSLQTQNIAIQIFSLIMATSIAIIVVRVADELNKTQIRRIAAKEEEQENLVMQIKKTADSALQESEKISIDVSELKKSIEDTVSNMSQVSEGSSSITVSVQSQLMVSGDIVKEVAKTVTCVNDTLQKVDIANEAVESGKTMADRLNEQTRIVDESAAAVSSRTELLIGITDKQKEIIELISGIAHQTNLLALNASIEAARAGESGKGFAVVAKSITELANKTTSAISSIDEMVASLKDGMDGLRCEVETMNETVAEQKQLIDNIHSSFLSISDSIETVRTDSREVSSGIMTVSSKNDTFTDSISSLSAVSEEMEASAQHTLSCADSNKDTAERILEAVNSLNEVLINMQ